MKVIFPDPIISAFVTAGSKPLPNFAIVKCVKFTPGSQQTARGVIMNNVSFDRKKEVEGQRMGPLTSSYVFHLPRWT